MKDAISERNRKLLKRMKKDLEVKWLDDPWFAEGSGTEKQKRTREIQLYKQAKGLFDTKRWFNKRKLQQVLEKLREIDDECDLNKEPRSAIISINKGVVIYKSGNDEAAIAHIKDAVQRAGGKWDKPEDSVVVYANWNLSVIRLKDNNTSGVQDMLLPISQHAKNNYPACRELNQEYPFDRLLLMRAMMDGRDDLVQNMLSSVSEGISGRIWDTDDLNRYVNRMGENRVIRWFKDKLVWVRGIKIDAIMERLSLSWKFVKHLNNLNAGK